jgi:hypothetical protein
MAANKSVELHPAVKEIAAGFLLENGRMVFSDEQLAKHSEKLKQLTSADEKKAVLVSLVSLASRLLREGKDGAAQPIVRLMELSGELLGDPVKAKAVFESAGIPGTPPPNKK